MSNVPSFTIKQLLEVGAHFGHKANRWNPEMKHFIYGVRDGTHILDLQQTAPMLHKALKFLRSIAASNGRVLFVGTKLQASDIVAQEAKRCGQYYINHRWLGGTLTNWKTVSASIATLGQVEQQLQAKDGLFTKKELLDLERRHGKLDRALGGIRKMGGRPDALFVIDSNKEHLAIAEATLLGIPVIAIVDSNANPNGITFPIPANDDAARAIRFYCRLVSDAVLSGIQHALVQAGTNVSDAKEVSQADIEHLRESASKKKEGPAHHKKRTVTPTAKDKAKTRSKTQGTHPTKQVVKSDEKKDAPKTEGAKVANINAKDEAPTVADNS